MEQSPRNRSLSSYIKKIGYYFLFEQKFYRKWSSCSLNNLLQYSLHLLKYKLRPAHIDRENQMNQSDFKANTCSRYKAREKSVSKSWFVLFSILTGWYSWVRVSANHLQKVLGKSKVNATRLFGSFQRKIYRSNGLSKTVVLLLRTEYSKRKLVFHFSKVISDTSFTPSRPFFGKWNWFVQMVNAIPGRNLPLLKFNQVKYLEVSVCQPGSW